MGIFSRAGAFMAMQFEKRADGYVYRANGKGPARPVTEAEFQRFVHGGGVSFLLHVAALGLAIVAAAMVTSACFPEGDEAGGFVLMGVLLLGIGYSLYRSVHWAMLAPERALAQRTPVAPAREKQSRRQYRPQRPVPGVALQPSYNNSLWVALGFAVAELVGGIGSALLAGWVLGAAAGAIAPASGWDEHVAIGGALIVGGIVTFLIDLKSRRVTGGSILDLIFFGY